MRLDWHLSRAAALYARGENAGQQSEEVAFPRDVGVGWQHPPHETAVEEECDQGDKDRPEAAVVPAARHQVAEVPEDETACADVVGHPPEEPHRRPTTQDDEERRAEKRSPAPQDNEPAKYEKREGVHQQVAEVGVQKRTQRDAAQTHEATRQYSPDVELMPR